LANPKSTQLWFAKARMDLRTAKHLTPTEPDFFSGIVFHSQQCAEKAIKGFLTYHNVRVLKTHDMEKLLQALSQIDASLLDKYSELGTMTKYAVEYRYPDIEQDLAPLTEAITRDSIALAQEVFNDLAARIGEPLPLA